MLFFKIRAKGDKSLKDLIALSSKFNGTTLIHLISFLKTRTDLKFNIIPENKTKTIKKRETSLLGIIIILFILSINQTHLMNHWIC